jgi:branched-subunit amino acid aminotransferase/4-amino-4-deoxychorismate lyase
MPTIFLNTGFVSPNEPAMISAFDAGFQHGVGLFETLLAVRPAAGGDSRVLFCREHLDRLAGSAKALGLTESLHVGALEEAVQRTVDRAFLEQDAVAKLRVRLTITGGDLNLLDRSGQAPAEPRPTLLIVATPATLYPDAMFEMGSTAVLADYRVNPLDTTQSHKTLNYWARLRELQVAAGRRAGEALVFQVTNHLAGGCVSNAILIKDDEAITPICRGEEIEVAREQGREVSEHDLAVPSATNPGAVMPSPVLPGVTRRWALDVLSDRGLVVRRRMVTISDVLGADEVILTNSSWGALPITRVEAEPIGTGEVGEAGRGLVEAWRALVV